MQATHAEVHLETGQQLESWSKQHASSPHVPKTPDACLNGLIWPHCMTDVAAQRRGVGMQATHSAVQLEPGQQLGS